MKCELCEYEIPEKNNICDKCGFDSVKSNFTNPGKLQSHYKSIISDHWFRGVDLIGKVYNILSSRSYKGAQKKCAEILDLNNTTISNQLNIFRFVAKNNDKIMDLLHTKSISQALFICKLYEEGRQKVFLDEDELQNHLFSNWAKLTFTKEWILICNTDSGKYKEGKDLEIDLLAQNIKNENHWLIIELKHKQAKDKDLTQVLSYMSYVRENLLEKEGIVEGCIIAGKPNKRLNQYIEKSDLNLRYFVWDLNKNENLYLKYYKKNKIINLDYL